MGFFSDAVDGFFEFTADVMAKALTLPLHVVQAAIDAGCKTKEEIEDFVDRNGLA